MFTKPELHEKLVQLIEQEHVSMARVARESGVKYSSVKQFRYEGKGLGEGNTKRLTEWIATELRRRQASRGLNIRDPKDASNPVEQIGILLMNIANFMQAGEFTLTARVNYLKASLDTVRELIPELEKAAEQADGIADSGIQRANEEGRK